MIQRTRIKFCGFTRVEDVAMAVSLGVDAIGIIFAERSMRRVSLALGQQLRAVLPPFTAAVALVMDQPIDEVQEIVNRVRPTLLQFHGAENEADCLAAGLPYLKALAMGEDGANRASREAAMRRRSEPGERNREAIDRASREAAMGRRSEPGKRNREAIDRASREAAMGRRSEPGERNREAIDAAMAMAGYPSACGFVLDGHLPGESGGSGDCFDWSRWPQTAPHPILLAGGLNPANVYAAVRQLKPFAVDVASGIEYAAGKKSAELMANFVAEVRRADFDNAAGGASPFTKERGL